jgi:hypothetical protein
VFLSFSTQKIREEKFKNAPSSFGYETYGDVILREGAF